MTNVSHYIVPTITLKFLCNFRICVFLLPGSEQLISHIVVLHIMLACHPAWAVSGRICPLNGKIFPLGDFDTDFTVKGYQRHLFRIINLIKNIFFASLPTVLCRGRLLLRRGEAQDCKSNQIKQQEHTDYFSHAAEARFDAKKTP